jgi:thioredoxin-like negative regulator of GroEL
MLHSRRWIALAAVLAVSTSGARADEDIVAKVEAALKAAEGFGGTSFHLTDPVAKWGAPAVPALAAVLADANAPVGRRMLAACALGRMDAPEALAALRAALARAETSQSVRAAVEENLFLRGDTAHVDARVASLATKYRDMPIAEAGARRRLAEAHAATGRFRIAADLMKDLARSERESRPDMASADAHNWACYAALAGAKEEALEAVRFAVESERTDLDWMAKDLDLALLHGEAAFVKTLADARARRTSKGARKPDLKGEPGYAEYRAMHEGYWGAMEAWWEANNRRYEDYQAWLERTGRTDGPEADKAYEKEKGPFTAKDPTPEWLPKFGEFLAKHRGTALGRDARSNLITIHGNKRNFNELVDLFLDALTDDPDLRAAGDHADTALSAAAQASPERLRAVREAVGAAVSARPSDPAVPALLLALAESQSGRDDDAARAMYTDVARRFPDTDAAKEAKGVLYEMERLGVGASAPDFAVTDDRGRAWTLSALRGRVVVLDFWATWCGPCLGEMPHVKKVFEAQGGAGAKDFVLLGISLDEDGWALAEFL